MWLFYGFAGLAVVSGLWAIVAPKRQAHARTICALAIAGICVQMLASGVAVILGAMLVVGSAGLWRVVGETPGLRAQQAQKAHKAAKGDPGKLPLLAGVGAIAWLIFIVVGTLARQFVWAGKRLSVETTFGAFDELSAAIVGDWPLVVFGMMLAAQVAGLAWVAHTGNGVAVPESGR
ncbi:MAG: hypothetical protein ACPG4T_03635 [Nannocystaceae bacterium]